MTIPKSKEKDFVVWFKEIAGPSFDRFGAIKHELYREEGGNRYVERVFFVDSFDVPSYLARAKADSEAGKLSRMYEGKFDAKDIELKVLTKVF